ncbi:MAG: hypothetical protein PHD25_00495 [Bacteroidales bacterium]|nr:hypothetical protein [Bacteroidales bacterium]
MRLNIDTSVFNNLLVPVYLILSSLLLLWPVLYNGYPLFYSDSAIYILASNLFGSNIDNNKLPYLSGIGYALFIRMVSWRATLYLVVLAQALILNVLIYFTLETLIPKAKKVKYHLPIILILSLGTSMSWTVSQLMPDIFTSYLVLSVFMIFSKHKKSLGMYIFLSIVICFSILSHLSHITFSILLAAFLLGFSFFLRSSKKDLVTWIKKSVLIVMLIFISIFIILGLNKRFYNYRGLSPTGSIFLMARLMDTGFMGTFLDEKCEKRTYEMCAYRNSLPYSYEDFLWSPESVFHKTGGWDITKHTEYGLIIRDVLTTPKYFGMFLYDCGEHSLRQLITFETGEGLNRIYNKESPQYKSVIQHFNKREIREDFLNSKQTQGRLKFDKINIVHYSILFVSIIVIMLTLIRNRLNTNMILFTFIILLSVIVNAVVTSSLSSVFNRFQSRMIWSVPLLACVCFSVYLLPLVKTMIVKQKNE